MFIIVSMPNSTCMVRCRYDATASQVSTAVTRVQTPRVNSTNTPSIAAWAILISVGSVTWYQIENVGLPNRVTMAGSTFQ